MSGINRVSGRAPAVPELDTLAKLSLFDGLPTEQVAKLRGLLQCKRSPAGAEIISVGHPGESIYIILEGTGAGISTVSGIRFRSKLRKTDNYDNYESALLSLG